MTNLAAKIPLPVQAAAMRGVFRLPAMLKRLIAGKPVTRDGQTLALDAQLLVKLTAASGINLTSNSVAESRAGMEINVDLLPSPPLDVTSRDLRMSTPDGELPARLYTPRDYAEPGPLLVYFHGGGWVLGSVRTHDYAARFLAEHSGVRVLSVEYRLAPEHRFPAAVDDALAAFDYAHKHADELGVDQQRIAVGGDSAGGNLAAVTALQCAQRGGPAPVFQLLVYPEVDFVTKRRSRQLFAEGFFLTDADMNWFEGHYLSPDDDRSDPRISPLLAGDLSGLPPAYLVTAGFDPLRDNGHAYAKALEEAGVSVSYQCQRDMIHGFINFAPLGGRFREATLEIAAALRAGLAYAR
ncbi:MULTISPECIES: alpha/beta hydrolase [Thermocrispum]|jgi:acetyl esterase|uniref:Alpha/beta hydrolase n=2 Tax=Thermocrispum agreste TaxID=37925 RepID=A0ABD6FDZ1_9PSEU|nr:MULTISPECIES: alpha/beta hydrolase [Thermocrispum]